MKTMSQRRISYERAAEIFRAIECRALPGDAPVTIEEAESYIPARTFGEFIERNRQTVQLYETPSEARKRLELAAFTRESDYWRSRGFSEQAADTIAAFAVGG